ncbi:MAG: acyl carrier protein [Janthinobacterium lividum]
MQHTDEIIAILHDVLALGPGVRLNASSQLLGSLPELDSMAVINLITALEDTFGISVDDDDIGASTFETVATLTTYVNLKIDALDA